eukprot:COSAG06_NODE_2693_length_6442_cov_5.906826_11_plen_60_part_00
MDVIREDGSVDAEVFPVSIPPDQVFTDIGGLEHAVRKTPFFEPCLNQNDRLAKTGSGQA